VNVLVVNCGSSSVKYSLFRMPAGEGGAAEVRASGIVERIGLEPGRIRHRAVCAAGDSGPAEAGGRTDERDVAAPDHEAALALMINALSRGRLAVIAGPADIQAVGHRVVHGAEQFTGSVRVTGEVIRALKEFSALAPLHNPPNLVGIRAAQRLMPAAAHVAVFDTAFHQTLPPRAFLYALPYDLYAEHRIRRYGFHGTSHRYVTEAAAGVLGLPLGRTNLITCHLGNGCSAAAVEGGKSVDTSMGLTPLEGLVMGTRSGDLDPAVVFHLVRAQGMTPDEVDDLLNRRSGLLGVSGVASDMRDVMAAAAAGDRRAGLALDIFCYRLRKYIGAYTAVLGRVDGLVFTGGIGENSAEIRERTCCGLQPLGYVLDAALNAAPSRAPRDVAAPGSRSRILVIPTDEELLIARDTARLAAAAGA